MTIRLIIIATSFSVKQLKQKMYKLRIMYYDFSLLLQVATFEAPTLLIEDVSECLTHVIDIYNHIELCHFLKILYVST